MLSSVVLCSWSEHNCICYKLLFGTHVPWALIRHMQLGQLLKTLQALPEGPAALDREDLCHVLEPLITGTYQSHFIVSHANNLSLAHISLVESYNLISMPVGMFAQEVPSDRQVPKKSF